MDVKVKFDAQEFINFLENYKSRFAELNTPVEGLILNDEVVDLMTNAHFQGKVDTLDVKATKTGSIMEIAGVRIYPTKKVDMFHPLFILKGGLSV